MCVCACIHVCYFKYTTIRRTFSAVFIGVCKCWFVSVSVFFIFVCKYITKRKNMRANKTKQKNINNLNIERYARVSINHMWANKIHRQLVIKCALFSSLYVSLYVGVLGLHG